MVLQDPRFRWNEWVDQSRILKINPENDQMRRKLLDDVKSQRPGKTKGKGGVITLIPDLYPLFRENRPTRPWRQATREETQSGGGNTYKDG